MAAPAVGRATGPQFPASGGIAFCRPEVSPNVVRLHEGLGNFLVADFSRELSPSAIRMAHLHFDPTRLMRDSRAGVARARMVLGVSNATDGGDLCQRDPTGMRRSGLLTRRANSMSDSADDGFIRSKLAVFLSGGGSNFRILHNASLNNLIYGDVVMVVSDKPDCKGCEYARENNLPVLTFPVSRLSPDGLSAANLVSALRSYEIDFILLAGYLKLLPSELVQAYPRSILNIHPSLLPAFGGKGFFGMKVHEAVIKSGARFSGATIHFVDETFDTGPILAQRIVPVLADDTPKELAAKILKVEHLLYTEAVAALCEDRIFWRDDGVPIIRKSWNEADYY